MLQAPTARLRGCLLALDNRLELLQQQARIDNASVTLGAAKNNLLPQLNLVGSVGANGVDNKPRPSERAWPAGYAIRFCDP